MIGGRLKPKRLPPPKEFAEQALLCRWLTFRGQPHFSCANGAIIGGKNRFAAINRLKQTGMVNGAPDLILVRLSPQGPVAVEMKRSTGGVLSEAQARLHEEMTARGWVVVIGHGFDDARTKLEALGF